MAHVTVTVYQPHASTEPTTATHECGELAPPAALAAVLRCLLTPPGRQLAPAAARLASSEPGAGRPGGRGRGRPVSDETWLDRFLRLRRRRPRAPGARA